MIHYYCDDKRHLVCMPYSVENLHKMAEDLKIRRHWFHRDHYDIPLSRVEEIKRRCIVVDTKDILRIIGDKRKRKR